MNFDGSDYERAAITAFREAADRLEQFVILDEWGAGPSIEFLCPRGHSLKRYRVERGTDGLRLMALPGLSSRRRGAVAKDASPFRARRVCEVPGCPNLLPCDVHPQQSEEVHDLRTGLTCVRCRPRWEDAYTTARLLKVYGVAVQLGYDSIPVNLTTPRTS